MLFIQVIILALIFAWIHPHKNKTYFWAATYVRLKNNLFLERPKSLVTFWQMMWKIGEKYEWVVKNMKIRSTFQNDRYCIICTPCLPLQKYVWTFSPEVQTGTKLGDLSLKDNRNLELMSVRAFSTNINVMKNYVQFSDSWVTIVFTLKNVFETSTKLCNYFLAIVCFNNKMQARAKR